VLTTGVAGRRHTRMDSGRKRLRNYRALTRALAVESAPIRVNAVCPGVVRRTLAKHECNAGSTCTKRWEESARGRVGEACEIARAYLFLMQEGYSTGQTVVLDGGAVRLALCP